MQHITLGDTSMEEHWFPILEEIFDLNESTYKNAQGIRRPLLENNLFSIISTVKPDNAATPALSTIAPEALSQFPEELRELQLNGYRIDRLPPDFGMALPHLVILAIRAAGLSSIPDSIGNLHNLTALRLDGNHLTGLPDSIGRLLNLKMVTLSGNIGITAIPPGLLAPTDQRRFPRSLRELVMRSCSVRTIPPNIRNNSRSLTKLDLHGNHLREDRIAWDALSEMESLETLILSDNNLHGLPRTFEGAFPRLETLDLSNTRLMHFPPALLDITTLKYLMLAGNYFQEVPNEISQMAQLQHLDLSGMPTLRVLSMEIENLMNLRVVLISRYDTDADRVFSDTNARILRFLTVTRLLTEIPE